MRWLKKLLAKRDDPDAAARELARGVELARAGQLEAALSAYRRALLLFPDYPLGHLNEALALQDLYNRDVAALEDDEKNSRLADIRDLLERAVELEPDLAIAWRHLGHVNRRLGHFVRAEEAFQRVLAVADDEFPHREEAERELRLVAVQAERQRALRDAIALAMDDAAEPEAMQAALELVQPLLVHPETPDDAFWATGVLLRRLEDVEGAREMFEACVERAPRHFDARRELATLCMQAGDMSAALEHSLEAYREDPANAALICNVGVCHLSLGDMPQAIEFLTMARDLAPGDAIVQRAFRALEDARVADEA